MRYLLVLFLCFIFLTGSIRFSGVSLSGVTLGYAPRIMFVGDSITVGFGDDFTYNGTQYQNIGGMRTALQKKLGVVKRDFTGQWGYDNGTNTTNTPELETRDSDFNHRLKYDFQPRHFGFGGRTIQEMVDAFTDLEQVSRWFPTENTKNLIVIHLGTNNSVDQFDTPDPCSFEDPDWTCTGPRIMDNSSIVGDVAYLLSIITDDIPVGIPVIICAIVPFAVSAEVDERLGYLNDWVIQFNDLLTTEVVSLQLTRENLYFVNMYDPLIDGWVDGTYSHDRAHPNNAGYTIMAEQIYNKMVEKDLL